MEHGATVKVLFLTEYSIMAVISLTTWVRLTLHAINMYQQVQQRRLRQQEEGENLQDDEVVGWEGHERAIFYLDIASDLLQSLIYILFFVVIMVKYGLPIHLLRDIYVAIHSVIKRFNDLLHYRRLVTNLDQRFPEATAQDLADNHICVVCRSEMRHGHGSVKKLLCGHMFHAHCLRGWLERGQNCPTCVAPVDRNDYERYLRDRGELRAPAQPQAPHQAQQLNVGAPNVQEIEQLQQALQQQYNQILESLQNTALTTQSLNQVTPFDQALLQNSLQQQTTPIDHFHNIMMNMMPSGGFSNEGADAIMRDMYITYLEHLRVIVDDTLVKLRRQQEEA
jgi:E3 ubiquitin-protein ligase synoviolin